MKRRQLGLQVGTRPPSGPASPAVTVTASLSEWRFRWQRGAAGGPSAAGLSRARGSRLRQLGDSESGPGGLRVRVAGSLVHERAGKCSTPGPATLAANRRAAWPPALAAERAACIANPARLHIGPVPRSVRVSPLRSGKLEPGIMMMALPFQLEQCTAGPLLARCCQPRQLHSVESSSQRWFAYCPSAERRFGCRISSLPALGLRAAHARRGAACASRLRLRRPPRRRCWRRRRRRPKPNLNFKTRLKLASGLAHHILQAAKAFSPARQLPHLASG